MHNSQIVLSDKVLIRLWVDVDMGVSFREMRQKAFHILIILIIVFQPKSQLWLYLQINLPQVSFWS